MVSRPLAERIYRLLLRCYPGEFRDEYAAEMLTLFRDRLGSDRRVGARGAAALWWQLVLDAVVRAPREHLDVLRQDIRYALRSLRRAPAFALTAIGTLALGIGANTTMFSIVHAVALQPLPYHHADRLVRIWERNDALALSGFSISLPNYVSWKERSRTMDVAAWRSGNVTMHATGDPVRVPSAVVSTDLFDLFGVEPLAGRLFRPAEDVPSASPVAVITAGLWRTQFGGRDDVIGSTVTIAGTGHTLIGVIPEDSVPITAEFFMPLHVTAQDSRDNRVAQVVARLKEGVALDGARTELESIARQLESEFPGSNRGWGVTMDSVFDWLVEPETRRALYVLLAAVACVLLITCSNIAGLMLARASARRREVALRIAIGAARRRLVRQVLTEGLVLTSIGGICGVLLASWALPVLRSGLPSSLPRADEAAVNTPVLLFSLAVCGFTALAFALLPALSASRGDVVETLKDGARGSTSPSQRSRQALAIAQVALATMLLAGAGLMIQSLDRLQRVELGFDPGNITTAMIGLPGERYAGIEASWAFYQRLLERLGSSPGVTGVALSSGAPFGGGNTGMPITPVRWSQLNGAALQTDWRMVSPGYFEQMRIPLLRGRDFTGVGSTDKNTIVASRTMARRMWGDEDPIGRQIQAGPNGVFTVVGVVGDVRQLDLSIDPAPTMYLPTSNYVWSTMTIILRTSGPGAAPASLIRGVVRELDPQLALHNVREMEALVSESAAQRRLNASLTSLFAALAGLLAAIGIYGVLAYLVSQRKQEIGIRMALGAARSSVLRLFLQQGFRLAAAGLVLGLLGALASSRWLDSMVFGISARDPRTFVAAALTIAVITLIASYIPAWRATRTDPLSALRLD